MAALRGILAAWIVITRNILRDLFEWGGATTSLEVTALCACLDHFCEVIPLDLFVWGAA